MSNETLRDLVVVLSNALEKHGDQNFMEAGGYNLVALAREEVRPSCVEACIKSAGRDKVVFTDDDFSMLMLAIIEAVEYNRDAGYNTHADKYFEIYEKIRNVVPRHNKRDIEIRKAKLKL